MTAPQVSVCIPVYNPGTFLADALRSVLEQEFADFELIIVDDCSAEPVAPVVEQFRDSRIRFHRNSRNLGLVGNWNRCIELADGEYVTIFHQDDLMLPENLRAKAALLDATPNMGFVYSNIVQIDSHGQRIGGHPIQQPELSLVMEGCALFELVAQTGNPVSCPSVMARSECYQRLGGFDARLPFATDLEMWLRIASHYDVGFLSMPLIASRVHPAQETARFAGSGRDYVDVLRALKITFSRSMPGACAAAERDSFATLAAQALGMAKWRLKDGALLPALRYGSVAALARLQSYRLAGRRS